MSDLLLAGLAAGRDDAYAAIYDLYGPALFRVAWTLLGSHADAEDAVQDVFLGLARARALAGQIGNLRAYLFCSLRHAVARLAIPAQPDALRPCCPDTVEVPASVDLDLSEWLERALARLPDEQREVLTLKIDGELTFAEVAEVLGIPPDTAASRYRYALGKLRQHYDEEYHAGRVESPAPQ